ncbi:hypothetical protein Hanom_Chr10g00906941 [Helianthus anomalus]
MNYKSSYFPQCGNRIQNLFPLNPASSKLRSFYRYHEPNRTCKLSLYHPFQMVACLQQQLNCCCCYLPQFQTTGSHSSS